MSIAVLEASFKATSDNNCNDDGCCSIVIICCLCESIHPFGVDNPVCMGRWQDGMRSGRVEVGGDDIAVVLSINMVPTIQKR
jgi:hypothetical protein